MIIGMVLFPNLTQLDLTGPHEVFGRLPGTKVLLIAESIEPVKSDSGLWLTPDTTFESSPQVDLLFVPGGRGIFDAMQNKKLIGLGCECKVHHECVHRFACACSSRIIKWL
jgi:cyclohexyl-isocyanide hydratase